MVYEDSDSYRLEGLPQVDLSAAQKVGEGTKRSVYVHPEDRSRLVKVVRPDRTRNWTRPSQSWKRLFFRSGAMSLFIDEIREELTLHARGEYPPFLAPILAICSTNLGIGLIYPAIRDDGGAIARDVRQLIVDGRYEPEVEAAVEEFLERVLESPLIISDLSPSNISCPLIGGKRLCFIVDGIGDDTLLRLPSLSPFANRLVKRMQIRRCRRLIRETVDAYASSNTRRPEGR